MNCTKKHPPLKTSQLNESDNTAQQTKTYHNKLLRSIDNVSTEQVTEEIRDVIQDITETDTVNRTFTWNEQDIQRLNNLNTCISICR